MNKEALMVISDSYLYFCASLKNLHFSQVVKELSKSFAKEKKKNFFLSRAPHDSFSKLSFSFFLLTNVKLTFLRFNAMTSVSSHWRLKTNWHYRLRRENEKISWPKKLRSHSNHCSIQADKSVQNPGSVNSNAVLHGHGALVELVSLGASTNWLDQLGTFVKNTRA